MNLTRYNDGVEQIIDTVRNLGFVDMADTWARDYAPIVNAHTIRIAFIGEFNHGKSSIINSLCGQAILPSGMTPTTQIDTDIAFDAPKDCVTAWSGATEIAQWSLEEWKKKAVKLTSAAMQKAPISRIQIALRQPSPDPMSTFIDTPGLNESSLLRESGIEQTLARADIVVFALDANQALTHTEMNFISHLAEKVEYNKRILVINKCDYLESQDLLQICAHVESATAPILGDDLFYMISARRPEFGDWSEFCAELSAKAQSAQETVSEDAERRIESALRPIVAGMQWIGDLVDNMSRDARNALALQYDASPYAISPQQLAEHIAKIETQMAQFQTEVQNDTTRFEREFLRAIARELDKASIEDIANYVEDFIDDAYAQFATREIESYTDALQKLCADTWQVLGGVRDEQDAIDVSVSTREAIFDSVLHNIRNSSPTGAFDATRLRIAGLVFKPMIAGRIERPVRETLCAMAEKAIARRSTSYQIAFRTDLSRFCTVVVGIARELGPAWRQHILQVIRRRAK